MFDKWMQYSYAAQKYQRNRLLTVLLIFVIIFIVYNCITAFLVSVWVVDNNVMQPGLASGDRILFTSFMLPVKGAKAKAEDYPFKRGSIVIVDKGRIKERKAPLKLLDGIVRFFTLQRASIFSGEGQYYIKRVIALPGDEINMVNFVFRVKPAGSPYSLTEFELSERPYHPSIPNIPALWGEAIPFSGNMETKVLGPNECYVISDDRSNTNDSRTWGPIPPSAISAKAILRLWPLNKFDLL
jgi:signal peptidase I